ncbi:MAG: hypothetical protein LBS31_13315, partial [Candidatus Adiutrix sp.]|nr:hypothetical protein [Candidatus Adiutrix sp.]
DGPTAYCEWRFCRRAVLLDVAGRYALPDDPADDLEEWNELVRLLAANRPSKPLDGIVLVLPVDLILSGSSNEIEEAAAAVRLRLEDLAALADETPPVFIMVSKLDLLYGAADLAALLRPDERRQALGALNELNLQPPLFAADALEEIVRELKERRLPLSGRDGRHARALGLPGELETLAPGLEKVVGRLGENPYQQPVNLRGLFFSAARAGGQAKAGLFDAAPFENDSAKAAAAPAEQARAGGLFLHDFFGAVLPGERHAGRLRPAALWRKARRRAAFLGLWLLLLLGLLAYSGYSYRHVRAAQNELFRAFPVAPALNGDFIHDSLALSQFRDGIANLEARLGQARVERLWSGQGRETLTMLKSRFCRMYAQAVLAPMNRRLEEAGRVDPGDGGADSFIYAYLSNIIWRLDLLAGEDPLALRSAEVGGMRAVIMAFGPETPDISPNLGDMYISYIGWRSDLRQKEREAILLKDRFGAIIDNRGLAWLFEWMLQHSYAPPVRLSEFWRSDLPPEDDRSISAAFTAEGRRQIERLLRSLDRLFPENDVTDAYRDDFWRQYHGRYYSGWLDLARNFNQGAKSLSARSTRNDWLNLAGGMNGFDSPYLNFLKRMAAELSVIDDLQPKPNWAVACDKLVEIIKAKADEGRPEPLRSQIVDLARSAAEETAAKVDEKTYLDLKTRLQAGEALTDYLAQLTAFIPAVTSPEAGFILAQNHYARSQSDQLPGDLALADLHKMSALLGTRDDEEKIIWRLMEGPLSFLAGTVNQQAAAQLNSYWQDQVVGPTVYVPQQKMWATLFAPATGLVPVFIDKYAKGFIASGSSGWRSREWLGLTLPFTDDFFGLLNTGWRHGQSLQDAYAVAFTAIPPTMNPPTALQPNLVGLYLQCADGEQYLENYNYPAEATFNWKMSSCGDVTLMAAFEAFTAEKIWPGENGFVDFLNAFRQGAVTFGPDDFPAVSAQMKAAGIENLTVHYKIDGAEDIWRDGGRPVLAVPNLITSPWLAVAPADVSAALAAGDPGAQSPGEAPEGQKAAPGGGRP